MTRSKFILAFAGAIGIGFAAFAGQVPNPINAPASAISANSIPYWATTNAQQPSAIAAVNNAIVTTNGTGVPSETTSLPSGITIPAGDLPLPTASSLGGVESQSCSSGQFLTGVPATATQPPCGGVSFSSVSGSATFAQLPAIASGDIYGRTTAGSGVPADTTLTAVLDAAIGSTQGNILYRGASSWSVLAPGTAGQSLCTSGASANPSWCSPLTPLGFVSNTAVVGGTSVYCVLWGAYVGSACTSIATEFNAQIPLAIGGTFRNLTVVLSGAPGTGNSVQVLLRVAGSNTAVTCTVSNAAATCSDTSHTAAITAGQAADFEVIPTGSPSGVKVSAGIAFAAP